MMTFAEDKNQMGLNTFLSSEIIKAKMCTIISLWYANICLLWHFSDRLITLHAKVLKCDIFPVFTNLSSSNKWLHVEGKNEMGLNP